MPEGLSVGCRAGLTLERYGQLAAFAIQQVVSDAAAVLLVEDGVPQEVRASSKLQFGALQVVAREWQGHCRREPGSALLGGYARDSARAEGSSIADKPGEC